jgi:2-keto-3-deoxy-L-rhamnonate aldolase RhmA
MNITEKQMTEVLSNLRENYGVVSVKAEFEAEGTRMDELLRLLDIARSAGLQLTVKIGGCEALRDLLESKQLGVKYIVAPMVETGYATSKYVAAKNIVYTKDEQEGTDFLFNLETITGFNNVDELINAATVKDGVDGIVFGRVDFVGSMNKPREIINLIETTDFVVKVAHKAKESNLQFVMGGGVSIDSLDVIKAVEAVHLDRFETRKVVFDAHKALDADIEKGLLDAVQFELLWLLNKRDYYSNIAHEDNKRISMLEARWEELKIRKEKSK